MESSRKNRRQVCQLFYFHLCVFLYFALFFFFFRKYLLSFIVYILELRVCDYLFSPNYVLLVVYFVTCSPELMSAGQTLLALRLWPGLILSLLMVSQWIKTVAGTALYLTPSPQTTLETRCHSKCHRSCLSEKLVCECWCGPMRVCRHLQ